MISFVVFAFLGVIYLQSFKKLPSIEIILLATSLWIFFTAVFYKSKIYYLKFFLKITLGFFFGFIWTYFNAQSVLTQQLPFSLEGEVLSSVGTIWSIPTCDEQGCQFEFKIESIEKEFSWKSGSIVILYWHKPSILPQVGERWHLPIKLKRPHAYFNPGSFDNEKNLFHKKIIAKGNVVKKLTFQKIEDSIWTRSLHRIRNNLRTRIKDALENRLFSGIIEALVTGLQSNISKEQWDILRQTGTSHLVAISGLHVGLLTGFIFQLVKVIGSFFPIRCLKRPIPFSAAIISLNVAILYALLAGFSVPTERAVIMISIVLFSIILKRKTSLWRNYCLTLGVVIFFDPLAVLAPGFWLSYGAVGIILYGMQGRMNANSLWWQWGRAQWVVFLGLIPFSVSLFEFVSLVSPIANLIAIPWVSFIVVPLALIGSFCHVLFNEHLGKKLLILCEYSLHLLWPILNFLSELPFSSLKFFSDSFFWILVAFLGVLWGLTPRGLPGKPLSIFCFLPLFLIKPSLLADKEARITVLDVGQGLSTIVETRHHTLIFDTGPKLSQHFNTGDQVVLPFLARHYITAVDLLLISHGDNDHAGSADAILKGIPVQHIMTSEPALFASFNPSTCVIGQQWEWDGVHFEILHPMSLFSKKRNDHACVLKVVAGLQSVLLTADIEAIAEQAMLKHNPANKLSATVLLVPHHGSKSSSTKEFIQRVDPKFAIIPVGYRNAYGHPHATVLESYRAEKIRVFNTVNHGAVSFTLNQEKDKLSFHSYRLDNLRYWHHETPDL
jgi:competence protein ComEC